jgi:hypothetical protein
MPRTRKWKFSAWLTALATVGALSLPTRFAAGQSAPLCAVVKLQISQQAAFEREAFNASLTITNSVSVPLTNLSIQIAIQNSSGNAVTSQFFISTTSLQNVSAVDGTGVIQSSSTASIQWLIIPSTGTGGTLPGGLNYGVTAIITAQSNGSPQDNTTFPANITVLPQPSLNLQYVLPFEVFGQEPLTPDVITPIVPLTG